MDGNDNRHIARDSLFLMADLRIAGLDGEHRIKVRNLSAGGMMGEGPVRVHRGAVVEVNIRNVGWVEGSVAWVQDTRFGIAFREEIDPKIAREPVGQSGDEGHTPRFTRVPIASTRNGSVLRKI
ncbi:PilZ domain-containing protein [Novosphingobium album (ex Liu et al. 2023)]|uniref:PilZ domain-containing protein n=1 Tax=Novosphingobium album (ex Liu et al. 2023) TaxID=3031130 RepID=A0ABT5WL70_9SPHN|nr:PilZ domain-containing protein [Novosphingobium album (ex Liu et al. 2023)]MDE8650783.1 PilZ domain-containing protein [Novosphingobium album (ex Liu et al. 2023)]